MIISHEKQWNILKKTVESNNIPHSFLFFGEKEIGKKEIALEFAKLINCESDSKNKKPCQECFSCKKIDSFNHPDLLIVEPDGKEIKIIQIREIKRKLSLKSSQSFFKVVIIDDAHLMNREAQAALLKTLEEPRGDTILVLLSDHLELLSLTILSRVQRIKFNKISRKNIEKYLLSEKILKEEVRFISFLSNGKLKVALDFIENKEKIQNERQKLNDFVKIIASDYGLAERFKYVKSFPAEESSLIVSDILKNWLNYFRECLLLKLGVVSEEDSLIEFNKILKKYSLLKIKKIIETIEKINFSFSLTSINPKLALEIIILEL